MQLEIITPDKTVFSGDAKSVSLPGTDGRFQILTNHAPMVASLAKGKIVIQTGNKEETILIDGGIVEVLTNKIVVLA